MRRLLLITAIAFSLGACASTKSAKIEETLDIRAAEIVDAQKVDIVAEREIAKQHYADGNFRDALRAYKNVLLHVPETDEERNKDFMGYADSALALSGEGEFLEMAEEAYGLLALRDDLTEDDQNRLLSGQVLLEIAKGDSEDAEVRLNEALETNLDDPRLWNALGHFHDRNQDWLIALETYVKALHVANKEDYPTAPVVNNMGMSLLLQKRTKEAHEKFEQAHKMNGDIRIYDNNRRLALVLSDRVDKAIKDLSDKRAARIYNDAGYIAALTDRTARARYFYKKAIELSPTYFEKAEINLAALTESESEIEKESGV